MKLQKKAIRIVTHSNYYAHTNPLFYNQNILNIIDIGNFQIAVFMYLCFTGQLPRFISNYFILNLQIHNYNTRNSVNYHYPKLRTTCMKNSIFFKGPELWNTIPLDIRSSKSIRIFECKYKKYLLDKYIV